MYIGNILITIITLSFLLVFTDYNGTNNTSDLDNWFWPMLGVKSEKAANILNIVCLTICAIALHLFIWHFVDGYLIFTNVAFAQAPILSTFITIVRFVISTVILSFVFLFLTCIINTAVIDRIKEKEQVILELKSKIRDLEKTINEREELIESLATKLGY